MFRLVVSSEVKNDLRQIYLWYEGQQKALGERFLLEFEEMSVQLINTPKNYPVVFKSKRRQVFKIFPYCNYFIIKGKTIQLIAVVHGKRHSRNWKKRS